MSDTDVFDDYVNVASWIFHEYSMWAQQWRTDSETVSANGALGVPRRQPTAVQA